VRKWIELAEMLQQVRLAEREFLGFWAVEEMLILPGIERVAADISQGSCASANQADKPGGGEYLT